MTILGGGALIILLLSAQLHNPWLSWGGVLSVYDWRIKEESWLGIIFSPLGYWSPTKPKPYNTLLVILRDYLVRWATGKMLTDRPRPKLSLVTKPPNSFSHDEWMPHAVAHSGRGWHKTTHFFCSGPIYDAGMYRTGTSGENVSPPTTQAFKMAKNGQAFPQQKNILSSFFFQNKPVRRIDCVRSISSRI